MRSELLLALPAGCSPASRNKSQRGSSWISHGVEQAGRGLTVENDEKTEGGLRLIAIYPYPDLKFRGADDRRQQHVGRSWVRIG